MNTRFRKAFHYYREHGLYRALFYNSNHIWLASFPRSGNTWMRHMLHDVLVKSYSESDSPSSLDIHHSVPDIHRHWDLFNIRHAPTPFIKTHFEYQKAYQKVIYLIRDPIDIIYSLWKVLAAQSPNTSITLEDVINQQIQQGWIYGRWDEHVLSYLQSGLNPDQMLVLKYEQIVADPLLALEEALNFSCLAAEKSNLVETATKHVDKMFNRDLHDVTSYQEKALALTARQVGKGYHHLQHDQIERIRQSDLGKLAIELGYTLAEK
jgi:hypothetical protein